MKLCQEPITVNVRDGHPERLFWKGRLYRVVAVEDRWRYDGRWWMEQPWRRHYYRLTTKSAASKGTCCFEVYRQNGQWTLSHILD
jgi:hypothetical protein